MTLHLREVEVDGRRVDVRCTDGAIVEIGPALRRRPGDEVLDAGGGALLPGLHDHHLHLMSMAAAATSVDLGPGRVATPADLDAAIAAAADAPAAGSSAQFTAGVGSGSVPTIRAVGYHESTGGQLDRARLDRLAPGRRVRVQHRSGHLWVLSSAEAAAVGLDASDGHVSDGHLYDDDARLADRTGNRNAPELEPIGRRLARLGVTGVTDATPVEDRDDWEALADAVRRGAIGQRVTVTGGVALAAEQPPVPLGRGPVKLVVSDHHLPDPDDLAGDIDAAHRAGRAVAIHCVTRVAAVLALAAWDAAGARSGDRMEHGAVLPDDVAAALTRHRVTVVTQPAFLWDRGDRYLDDVDPIDVPELYRCAGLLAAGLAVGGSTDAPFGPDDPWLAMAAAVDRRSRAGATLGAAERLAPRRALDLFLTEPGDPGGSPRRVAVGATADLCVLDRPLDRVLADLDAAHVVAGIVGGRVLPR